MGDPVQVDVAVPGVVVGWAQVEGCTNGPSPPGLSLDLDRAIIEAAPRASGSEAAARKAAGRDLLRHGAYKPTGRGKPASEYLLAAALEGRFPRINLLADINNLLSLESLLPISVVDLDRAEASAFRVRRGRPGESYPFNPSGQVLDLEDLLLTARLPDDRPLATPVKDCQETKTDPGTTRALAVIYAPAALRAAAAQAAERFAALAQAHGGARATWGVAP